LLSERFDVLEFFLRPQELHEFYFDITAINVAMKIEKMNFDRALGLFPREQLLLLGSEQLKRDPTGTIRTICDFLGVSRPAQPILAKISRPAADIEYPVALSDRDVAFLQRHFTDEMDRFRLLVGNDVLLA